MEFLQGETVLQDFFCSIPEITKIQIPHVILQVIGRGLQDGTVQRLGGGRLEPQLFKKRGYFFQRITAVVDPYVQKGSQTKGKRPVFLAEGSIVRIFFPQRVSIHFNVSSPAFCIASDVKKVAQQIRVLALERD